MLLFSLAILTGCDPGRDPEGWKRPKRTTLSMKDTLSVAYDNEDLKSKVDVTKDPRSKFVIKYGLGALPSRYYGTIGVKITFFVHTKDYVPKNEETNHQVDLDSEGKPIYESYENWSLNFYYADLASKKLQKVAQYPFELLDAHKKTINGVIGHEFTFRFWGLDEEVFKNPKIDPNESFDRIIWELFTDAIAFDIVPEIGVDLKHKTNWKDQKNNPYNYNKFTIINVQATVNDDHYCEFRKTPELYPHDLSQVKTFGTIASSKGS